ncbi:MULTISPECIES: hypothetical protein [unclassified Bradyrhizobium]|uniref:hypothetical protein n=1 Tax=unclassified Bradyrhizobium TaxID=2631580 RepID=UPI002916BE49|nr:MULTISPECIES: hypothetical protein [unclassified Bradyrhizobium]
MKAKTEARNSGTNVGQCSYSRSRRSLGSRTAELLAAPLLSTLLFSESLAPLGKSLVKEMLAQPEEAAVPEPSGLTPAGIVAGRHHAVKLHQPVVAAT